MSNGKLYKTKVTVIGPMQYLDGRNIREYFKEELGKIGMVLFDHYNKPFVEKYIEENETTSQELKYWLETEQYDKIAEKRPIRSYDLSLIERSDIIIFHFIGLDARNIDLVCGLFRKIVLNIVKIMKILVIRKCYDSSLQFKNYDFIFEDLGKSYLNLKIIHIKHEKPLTHFSEYVMDLNLINYFKFVETISFNNIHIYTIGTNIFENVINLDSLIFDHCSLTFMQSMNNISTLKYLSLNDYRCIHNDHFTVLNNLTHLNIKLINQCTNDESLLWISKLTKLNILEYKYKESPNVVLDSFKCLTSLTELYLNDNNRLTYNNIKNYSSLINLKVLYLKSCIQIDVHCMEIIGNMTNLEKLNVSHTCQLNDLGLKYISNLTNLKELKMSKLIARNSNGLYFLTLLTKLKSLKLSINTSDDFKHINMLKSLKYLNCDFNFHSNNRHLTMVIPWFINKDSKLFGGHTLECLEDYVIGQLTNLKNLSVSINCT